MTGGQRLRREGGRRRSARRNQPRDDVGGNDEGPEHVDPPCQRLVDQRLAVEIERIKEERRERQLAGEPIDVEFPAEAAHRDLKRLGKPVAAHRDHLAVEHDRPRRHRACGGDDFGNGGGHVAQVARVHLDLVVHFVQLDSRPIELVLEGRFAEDAERLADIGRGIGEHRLQRLKRREDEPG